MSVVVLHGKRATFVHRGCRCEPCREANAAYFRAYRARRKACDVPSR